MTETKIRPRLECLESRQLLSASPEHTGAEHAVAERSAQVDSVNDEFSGTIVLTPLRGGVPNSTGEREFHVGAKTTQVSGRPIVSTSAWYVEFTTRDEPGTNRELVSAFTSEFLLHFAGPLHFGRTFIHTTRTEQIKSTSANFSLRESMVAAGGERYSGAGRLVFDYQAKTFTMTVNLHRDLPVRRP
jgi:hypothetical protein